MREGTIVHKRHHGCIERKMENSNHRDLDELRFRVAIYGFAKTGDGIAAKMLSKELQDLEINLLVKRTVQNTKPITVEYELTPHGKTLERIITEIGLWGKSHRKKIIGR